MCCNAEDFTVRREVCGDELIVMPCGVDGDGERGGREQVVRVVTDSQVVAGGGVG